MKGKAFKTKWKFNEKQKNSQFQEDADVHIEFSSFGYSTLCGLGSEGVQRGNENYLERTSKIVTCDSCLSIYKFCNSVTL